MAASAACVLASNAAWTSNSCRLTRSSFANWACKTALKLPSKSRPKLRTDSGTASAKRRASSSNPFEFMKVIVASD